MCYSELPRMADLTVGMACQCTEPLEIPPVSDSHYWGGGGGGSQAAPYPVDDCQARESVCVTGLGKGKREDKNRGVCEGHV